MRYRGALLRDRFGLTVAQARPNASLDSQGMAMKPPAAARLRRRSSDAIGPQDCGGGLLDGEASVVNLAGRFPPTTSACRSILRISVPILTGIIGLSELALLFGCGVVARHVCLPAGAAGSDGGALLAIVLATWATSACLQRMNVYRISAFRVVRRQCRPLVLALLVGVLVLIACLTVLRNGRLPAWLWPADWLAVCGMGLGLFRLLVSQMIASWREAGRLVCKVALVGDPAAAQLFMKQQRLHNQSLTGLPTDVVGVFSDQRDTGDIARLLEHSQREALDAVLLTMFSAPRARIEAACEELSSVVASIYLMLDGDMPPASEQQPPSLCDVPLLLVRRRPLSDWQHARKMVFDRICSLILLLVLSPLLAGIVLLIKIDSAGPVLFRQPRIGLNNVPFICYKFRTMADAAADLLADRQTVRGDERLTRAGAWLRRYNLDELPQLLNVLRGEMSLVGPRPHAPNTKVEGRLFADAVAKYGVRHRVRPGITGWAQVNGWRGPTATIEQVEQRVAHDLYYIERWSLAFDIKILCLTVLREFKGKIAF
jgi:Undecaprenyl-phosphate glucose phosphotransferase